MEQDHCNTISEAQPPTETHPLASFMELEKGSLSMGEQHSTSILSNREVWNIFGYSIPKNEVMYFSQIIALYIVIIMGLINISIKNGDSNLWLSLLSGSIGYLLPNPSLKKETIILQRSSP